MIDRIDHIVVNCRDVEATAAWYEHALGFERVSYTSLQRRECGSH
jgi:catechol 2,3-dioxygenase-like lactoylglutathione lyase family enzyme